MVEVGIGDPGSSCEMLEVHEASPHLSIKINAPQQSVALSLLPSQLNADLALLLTRSAKAWEMRA